MGSIKNAFYPLCLAVALASTPINALAAKPKDGLDVILGEIEALENKSDPKCYATASRLEDFMFGTPLSDEARFTKHRLQQQWVQSLWQSASELAQKQGAKAVTPEHIKPALAKIYSYSQADDGHWQLQFKTGNQFKIHKDDKRHYGSIAYSLRTVLAVQQESLLSDDPLLPLTQQSVALLKEALDLFCLSVLKVADTQARHQDRYEIDTAGLQQVWDKLYQSPQQQPEKRSQVAQNTQHNQAADLTLLRSIVEQKVRSYSAYNDINNKIFVRNLQVYFARNRWPADEGEGKVFRQMFTETLIAFARDFYDGSQVLAQQNGHKVITESDVGGFAKRFIPHSINEYEDATFFPNLSKDKQLTIEAYDMDSFRDSGIHWRYLQFAVLDGTYTPSLEPDPFAAELLVENIAQFGVLLLRMTGIIGHERGEDRISSKHFQLAVQRIQQLIDEHANTKPPKEDSDTIHSSTARTQLPSEQLLFSDVTQAMGIDYMHRSSDWLSRQLRSYIKTGESSGTLTIPPAFGGSGVAAEDVNNDGYDDILILGGVGNRLYLNKGGESFEDVTEKAGLNWVRPQDKQPGEARQPLIADLDNDGLQDIVITYVNDKHRVYKNLGNGRFADVTDSAGLGGEGLVGGPATVFDYDNDGLLDIYISYFGNYLKGDLPTLKRRNENGLPNKLFRNTGNFKFVDVTAGSNVDDTGWGQAATHVDFDGDGLQDIISGNDFGVNVYYKNLGNGKFQDVSNAMGTDKPSYTMGIGTADLNGDLTPDIYISNIVTMNKDEKYVLPGEETTMKFNPKKLKTMRVIEANDLFISRRKDNQVDYRLSETVGRGYSSTGWSWDADFFDYDNDGDDDLYVLNGMNEFNVYGSDNPYYTDPHSDEAKNVYIPVSDKESNVFFSNEGGKLNNISKQSGVDLLGNSRSAAYFDLEGDGDLDMVLNNYHEKAVVYRNNIGAGNGNYLNVRLKGNPDKGVNLDAIGSQVIVTMADKQTIWRMVQGSTGYMSVHPKKQHFGLLKQKKVDIEVIWPNGKRFKLKDVAANQNLQIEFNDGVSPQVSSF